MKNLFIALCLILFANTVQATEEYLMCYRPPGHKRVYVLEPETGEYKLKLKRIKRIKDKSKTSIYFNGINVLVFKNEQEKKAMIELLNEHCKRQNNGLRNLETIFHGLFLDKLGNGWR